MWVKVCGLTSVSNAQEVAAFSPNAIGLNFYAKSPRSVTVETATEIAAALPDHVEPIGLFVNHSRDEILRTVDRCQLSTIQLHGDESAAFAASLGGLQIIRALRVNENTIDHLAVEVDQYLQQQVAVRAFLIDARVEQAYGGTGQTAPWDLVSEHYNFDSWPPLVLAGGLEPENVREAVAVVRPWGVDVASGVESSHGIKSAAMVKQFLHAARTDFSTPNRPRSN